MTDLTNKLFDLRDYDDDNVKFFAVEAEKILIDYDHGYITTEEYKELLEDLHQTKRISQLAEDLESRILIEELMNNLIKVIGAI